MLSFIIGCFIGGIVGYIIAILMFMNKFKF